MSRKETNSAACKKVGTELSQASSHKVRNRLTAEVRVAARSSELQK